MTGMRDRLNDRRAHWLYRFECDGQSYTGGIGRFEDGRIAEIFINGSKVGTAAETNAQDAAIVASLRSPAWVSAGHDKTCADKTWQFGQPCRAFGRVADAGVLMRAPEPQLCQTLIPFDKREGLTLFQAAGIAGKSVGTIRNWCIQHGLGRRVGGGTWVVSRVALAMFLDGDMIALGAYQAGDRTSPLVSEYFKRFGLKPQNTQSSQSTQSSQPQQG